MHPLFAAALPVALVLLATFLYAGVAAGSNAYQIKSNYDVSHLWETRERLAALIGFCVLAYVWPVALAAKPGLAVLCPLLAAGAAFFLFGLRFDIRLNLRRGLARDYVGTDPQTAATDKAVLAHGLTGGQYALIKLVVVVVLSVGAVAIMWAAA